MRKAYIIPLSSLAIALSISLQSCGMLEYHPYSVNLDGNRDINTVNARRIESAGLVPPFKFAFISDTQGSYDDTGDAINDIVRRGDIDFIVHGGDMTDFGLPKEYVWCRDMFDACGIPYVAAIGNHDCLGNGEDTFTYLFGPYNFSFNAGPLHMVVLNTVALEYDYSNPVPDLDFIENDVTEVRKLNEAGARITHTIITMHSRPYDEQFNNNLAKAFNLYIAAYPGMQPTGDEPPISFCINGHNHHRAVTDIFDNGILYYQVPNVAKREYFVFTITDEGYHYEAVEF